MAVYSISRRLELGSSQIQELEEIAEWYREERLRIRQEEFPRLYQRRDRTNMSLEEMRRDSESGRAAEETFESKFLAPFDKIAGDIVDAVLVPHQHRQLEDILLNLELRTLGLPNALIVGNLGKRLQVSQRQQDRPEKVRDKLTELLRSELRDFEEEMFAAFEQHLNPSQIEAWKMFIGNTNEGTDAAPSFLFMHGELLGSAMFYRN